MKNSFRVALVGCGAISGNHIKAILAAGQTLCALCDVDTSRTRATLEKYALGDLPCYTDYVALLQQEHPDAVHICTPHDLHAPMITEALKRGIHVLCEKPLCISIDELKALRQTVAESTAQLGICFQNRYEPTMLRLKELAKGGVRGGYATVVWKRDEAYYRSGAWRGTWKHEGGGVMINQAIHTLDILQWVCGFPTHVTAHISNDHLQNVIEVEDTATALFETAGGQKLHFFATTAASTDFPVQLNLRLASGEVVFATNNLLLTDAGKRADGSAGEAEELIGKSVWGTGHKRLIADFYAHLRAGTPFPIGLEEAEKVNRLVLAMYQSQGKRIEISM